jgi:hypothetical protein
MPVNILKTFSKLIEGKYADADADREAMYLEYLRARTEKNPEKRKRAADAYFARLEKDLRQPLGCSFVYDAYKLAGEFPKQFKKLAISVLDRGAYYQQCDLIRALGAEKNWEGLTNWVFTAVARRLAALPDFWEELGRELKKICDEKHRQAMNFLPTLKKAEKEFGNSSWTLRFLTNSIEARDIYLKARKARKK